MSCGPTFPGEADQLICEVLTAVFDQERGSPRRRRGSNFRLREADRGTTRHAGDAPVAAARDLCPLSWHRLRAWRNARGIDPGGLGAGRHAGALEHRCSGQVRRQLERRISFRARWAIPRLRGTVNVRYAQMGNVTADEIVAWMIPSSESPGPASPTTPRFQLERILARAMPDKASRRW